MQQPMPNEVWVTKSKRLAVIVRVFDNTDEDFGFLWFDTIDEELCLSATQGRLDRKIDMPVDVAINKMIRGDCENYE